MRFLYTALIYFTVALSLVTVWSLGHQAQAQAELSRAQNQGVPPEFLAAAARASTLLTADEPTCPTLDEPTARPWTELTSADLSNRGSATSN